MSRYSRNHSTVNGVDYEHMKNTTSDLPPKLQALTFLLDAQPPEVQEAFQFLPATAMHEAGKFELLNVGEVDGRWHYSFSGAGEVFSVSPGLLWPGCGWQCCGGG